MIKAQYLGRIGESLELAKILRLRLLELPALLAKERKDQRRKFKASARRLLARSQAQLERSARNLHLQASRELLEAFQTELEALRAQLEHHALDLALRVAETVSAEKIQRAPAGLRSRITRELSKVRRELVVAIRVAPLDYESVGADRAQGKAFGDLPIYPDETLRPGDFRLECLNGSFELRWSEHLAAIRQKLMARGPHAA